MHKNQLQLRDGVRKNRSWTHSCIEWNVWMQFDWNRTYHRAHLFRSTFLARLMRTTSTECFMPVQQTIALFMIFIVYSSDSNNTHHTRMTYNSKETVDGYMCICNTASTSVYKWFEYICNGWNGCCKQYSERTKMQTVVHDACSFNHWNWQTMNNVFEMHSLCKHTVYHIWKKREKNNAFCILRTMIYIYGVIWLVFRHNESFFAIKLTNFNIYISFWILYRFLVFELIKKPR